LRQALLIVYALAGAHGFLGMGDRCVPVPSRLCAVAYDDDGCKGWKLDIPVGEKMFKWWDPVYYWYRYPLLPSHKIFLYILKVGVPGVQN